MGYAAKAHWYPDWFAVHQPVRGVRLHHIPVAGRGCHAQLSGDGWPKATGCLGGIPEACWVETITRWVQAAWHWLFVDSGFSHWLASFRETSRKGSGLIPSLNGFGASLISRLGEYLQATLWVTLIFFIRVMILFLSIPLFGLVIIIGIVEGLVRHDLRRYGAGYESSFVYHHAKRFVKPALYRPCMLYLAWPTAVWPNLFLLPSALLVGGVLAVVTASFKKYL